MRPLLLATVLAVVAGCGASPPPAAPPADGPYAGIPSRPAEGPIATAQPVAPTGSEALDQFLAELAADIDRHDWLGVARRMDPEVFPEQRAFLAAGGRDAVAAPQLLAETLGIRGLFDGPPSWRALDRIAVVTLRVHDVQTPGAAGGAGIDVVEGDVRLEDGTTLPLSILLSPRGDGFVVVVPVG